MTLFSGPDDPESHRVRIVLAEKGLACELVEVGGHSAPEELFEFNPYGSVPTLVDRELVLYGPQVIMEFLDERFPHPPLMPVDPVTRAKHRVTLNHIARDLYAPFEVIRAGADDSDAARRELCRQLEAISPVLERKHWLLSDDYSLLDCTMAPLLWRLDFYRIELPAQAAPVLEYARRLFDREGFRRSLSAAERAMAA